MDTTAGCDPAAPLLLVRRAGLAGERDVAALLRDVPVGPVEVADLIRHHRVLVLSDLTLPPAAPPVAAAAFRLHWSNRTPMPASCAAPDGAGASLLASAGFTADHETPQADGRSPLVLLL